MMAKTVDRAKENLSKQTNVSLYCGDFLSYEFSEVFDLIYSSLTFTLIGQRDTRSEKSKFVPLLRYFHSAYVHVRRLKITQKIGQISWFGACIPLSNEGMHIEKKQKAINKVAALLKDNGKFVLAIDKNQDRFIDTGTRKMVSAIVAMTVGKQNHQLIGRLLPAILLDKMADLVSAKLIFMRLSIIKYKRT